MTQATLVSGRAKRWTARRHRCGGGQVLTGGARSATDGQIPRARASVQLPCRLRRRLPHPFLIGAEKTVHPADP